MLSRSVDRLRYAAAHGGLRLALCKATGRPLASICIAESSTGKPFTVGGPSFSLSYASSEAWAVIGPQAALGLDVVALDRASERLDRSFASLADLVAVRRHVPDAARPDLIAWAAKEAAAKLTDDVARSPERWRVRYERGLRVEADGHPPIEIALVDLGDHHVAAISQAASARFRTNLCFSGLRRLWER